ncbi:ribonuclease DdI-like [Oppia nitens]|uniref:ribonuclease DdI-like n=1 Tax=Oppia nitens TaxID=1686743 RepID=UPI0023DB02E9|nr:ribonuclease DdI-like [Oppia nitens]
MNSSVILLISLLTLSVVLCMSVPHNESLSTSVNAKACQINQTFGYVLLAVQWVPTFCNNTRCGSRNRNSWTVHGAWPQHTNNSWPQYCCFESTFNVSKIKSLESQLIQKWPTLKENGKHEDFWKHEWTKHGTCAMNSDKLKGHFNYFNHTLHLYDSFPLQSWLQSSNIKASNTTTYSLINIHNAVESRLGAKVELECLSKKPYPLLQHIYICLNRLTLKPQDCNRPDDKQCGITSVKLPLA